MLTEHGKRILKWVSDIHEIRLNLKNILIRLDNNKREEALQALQPLMEVINRWYTINDYIQKVRGDFERLGYNDVREVFNKWILNKERFVNKISRIQRELSRA